MTDKTNDTDARHERPLRHTSEVVLTDAAGRTWYHNGEDEWAADVGDGVWAILPLRALHRLHGPLTTNEETR